MKFTSALAASILFTLSLAALTPVMINGKPHHCPPTCGSPFCCKELNTSTLEERKHKHACPGGHCDEEFPEVTTSGIVARGHPHPPPKPPCGGGHGLTPCKEEEEVTEVAALASTKRDATIPVIIDGKPHHCPPTCGSPFCCKELVAPVIEERKHRHWPCCDDEEVAALASTKRDVSIPITINGKPHHCPPTCGSPFCCKELVDGAHVVTERDVSIPVTIDGKPHHCPPTCGSPFCCKEIVDGATLFTERDVSIPVIIDGKPHRCNTGCGHPICCSELDADTPVLAERHRPRPPPCTAHNCPSDEADTLAERHRPRPKPCTAHNCPGGAEASALEAREPQGLIGFQCYPWMACWGWTHGETDAVEKRGGPDRPICRDGDHCPRGATQAIKVRSSQGLIGFQCYPGMLCWGWNHGETDAAEKSDPICRAGDHCWTDAAWDGLCFEGMACWHPRTGAEAVEKRDDLESDFWCCHPTPCRPGQQCPTEKRDGFSVHKLFA